MYIALHASPMIPSYNIEETVRFFVALFNFSILRKERAYAVLCKDQSTIHILQAGNESGQMEFYLEVTDIDELWQNVQDKLTEINVKPPFDREYGMREMHIIIPNTNTLMFVGQAVRPNMIFQSS